MDNCKLLFAFLVKSTFTALEKTVMQGLMEQAVNEGENACFTAVVSHDDVKGSWFKDDEKIEVIL